MNELETILSIVETVEPTYDKSGLTEEEIAEDRAYVIEALAFIRTLQLTVEDRKGLKKIKKWYKTMLEQIDE